MCKMGLKQKFVCHVSIWYQFCKVSVNFIEWKIRENWFWKNLSFTTKKKKHHFVNQIFLFLLVFKCCSMIIYPSLEKSDSLCYIITYYPYYFVSIFHDDTYEKTSLTTIWTMIKKSSQRYQQRVCKDQESCYELNNKSSVIYY